MSSSINSKTISSAIKVGVTSSKVVDAVAPIISEALIEEMEHKQKSNKSKKGE
ncbi:hypothetical protein [Acaryochloris sp. IP29b_bin.148]|uniref:hypothetical protein n=1 Tax=Acaryochloris sp. IP29b_bin.148 TaxID=2969218 RepID=UPI002614F914|nr:hypothetical protein [Acaryochloris sp. IP29b_bin.148]